MDSNLNQLAPINFDEGFLLGQQPHENGFRASTFNEFTKWLNVRLDLQGAELIDPTSAGTSEIPAIIPPGPDDRKGKFEPEPGFYQGFPEIKGDKRYYFYWDKNIWSLWDLGDLPQTDTSELADADQERGGKNYVDLSKKTANKYVRFTDGTLVDSPDYDTTDFIYIGGLDYITISHFNHFAVFNEEKGFLSGKNAVGQNVQADQPWTLEVGDAKWIISSMRKSIETVFQIEEGTESTDYEAYVSKKVLKGSQLPRNVRTINKPLTQSDLGFAKLTTGKNKANRDSFIEGKYVNPTTGALADNATYSVTGMIPVNENLPESATEGLPYTFSYRHTLAWYNKDGAFISGVSQFDTEKTKKSPLNARFLNATILNTEITTFQIEQGFAQTAYEPYSEMWELKDTKVQDNNIGIQNMQQIVGSIQGLPAKRITATTLAGDICLSTADFPFHIKKNVGISASCKFVGLAGKIIVGKGFNKYRGSWIEIDATNIVWKFYEASAEVRGTVAHGLTLQDFLNVSIFLDDQSVCHVVLHTKNGMSKTTFQWSYEFNSEPFIRTEGQGVTDVILTASTKEIRKSIWFFGDSYQSVALDRWPGQLKEIGFFNILINALAGQTSTGAIADLQRCLKYGTPKYIVWGLGMNDTDAVWESNLNIAKGICKEKGIELILCTIPSVPSRSKEYISNYVRSSGHRYIDFYAAVGAQPDGTWISGYQEPGGSQVHPTELGAKALAMRVLMDFPEVMQYGTL